GTSAQTFAQEFRLAGSRDTLDWFVGVNYYREKLAENQNTILSNTNTLIPLGELARDKNIIRGDNDSYGIYADISWSLSTALRITAGLRYTVDEKAYCTQGRADLGFISTNTLAAVCDTERWEEVTPRLVVDYQLADTAMAYASISRGYKAGGYNPAAVDTDGDGYGDRMAAFAPEENISYELGIKSELLDNRLRLNAAVFYADYDELQVQQATVGGIIIDNAAAADIAGGEIELSYAASEYLTLSANYARVDGEYEDNGVYDGSQLIYSPENSYALNAKYRYPTATGEWSAFAFYSWQSETFYTPINNEALKEPSYGLLGARLAYSPSSGRWDIALAGDNLLDQEYAAFRQDIGIGLGPHLVRGLPRLYTLSFNLYL
ncbi:MAG: TonB-dependent receptor, partial [Cellvibrionaceae bacterium]|nr:TonB-dependent receptor [Cellvibrionaceae bacterium]